MKNKTSLIILAIVFDAISSVAQVMGTFTDPRDGKIYMTVKIGNQTWMAENLAYSCVNGCWTNKDKENSINTNGYLYNWETAKRVCPAGWHIPSDAEWTILINYLGGDSIAGGKLKSTTGWKSPNTGATNEIGFTALPGGCRYFLAGEGQYVSDIGQWWSSTEAGDYDAWIRSIDYNDSIVRRTYANKPILISVRCIKD
jgi:uncharacterized protein (TIGR02145 family)